VIAKMRNVGEACTAANRFLVQRGVADEFTRRLAARLGAMRVGRGTEDGVEVGPLIDARQRDSVASLVDDALGRGARALVGGSARDGSGYFYDPTVLGDVPAGAEILREEIFGPVAPVSTFDAEDELVAAANDTEYGLVAYVFTCDRPQPGHGLQRGGAVRRRQAVRVRPRGRRRGHRRVPRDDLRGGGDVGPGRAPAEPLPGRVVRGRRQ